MHMQAVQLLSTDASAGQQERPPIFVEEGRGTVDATYDQG